MAKNRKKKQPKSSSAMEISTDYGANCSQAMETSVATPSKPSIDVLNRTIKKGRPLKRSKNLRKQKALERAISKVEMMDEKASKIKNKMFRIHSAKSLYD